MKRTTIVFACMSATIWATAALGEGLYWESTMSGSGHDRTAQTYAMPKLMKIVSSDGNAVILRADQEKFTILNTKRQTYHEIGVADMEAATKQMQDKMQAARGEMEKRMKDLPPEQRAMVQQMMAAKAIGGAPNTSPVTIQNTGETKKIAGYNATKYIATQDNRPVLTAWTTKDVKGFDAMRNDWLVLQKRLTAAGGPLASALADAYTKLEGFPLETEAGEIKTTVTKIEPRTTPASEFEVPSGYKKESVGLPAVQ